MGERAYYTLADDPQTTILVACSKCPWQGAFSRADLITTYGAEYPMPNLLDHLAMLGCSKIRRSKASGIGAASIMSIPSKGENASR
jgi:hypothetical protein